MRPFLDWYVFHIHETAIDPARLDGEDGPIEVKVLNLASGIEQVLKDLNPILLNQPVDVTSRLNAGDSVAVAYHEGKAVGCSWFTRRDLPFVGGLHFAVRPDEAVCFGSFVLPEWRGKRIHPLLERHINSYLYARGIVRTCGSMSALNPQTLSLAKRTGKRKVMSVYFFHLKGPDWHFHFSTGDKVESRFRVGGLRINPDAVPELLQDLIPRTRRTVQ